MSGAGLTTAGFVLSRLLTLVTYLVLGRLAVPSVFGTFAAGSIVIGAGSIFVESGMLAALIQRRDRLEEATHTAFVATMTGGVALTLCSLAVSPLIGLAFSSRQIGLVAAAMSGVLLLGAGTVVPDALLQRNFSFLRRVVVDPLGVAAFGITSIVSLSFGLGVWGLVLATYASELAQVVAGWKASGFRPDLRRGSFGMWRELARYGRYVLAGTAVDHASLAANTFVVGRFLGTAPLGQYRYATRFGILPQELSINAASYVLLPTFARISHERARLERAVERSLRLLLAAIVPLSLLLVPLGVPLIVLLVGPEWHPAGVALTALCLASAPAAAGSVTAEALKASGRPDVLPRLHVVHAVLTVAFMLALLPFGLTGVALGYALGSALGDGYAVVRCARVQGFDLRRVAETAWPPYLAAFVMLAVLVPLEHFGVHAGERGLVVGLVLLVLEALLGLAVYGVCLVVVAPVTAAEVGHGVRLAAARVRGRGRWAASTSPIRSA